MEEHKLTAWQAFKDLIGAGKETPLVLRVYNPLALKPNDFLTIHDLLNGIAETRYQVTEVDVYRRTIGDRTFESVDYILQNSADEWLTVRASPNAGSPGSNEQTLLLLFPDYKGEYDEDLHKRVLPSGILEIKNDQGELLATYERLNGLKEPYRADVLVINEKEPASHESCEYWDFGRKRDDGREEFYFVEVSTETGIIQTWRAVETSDDAISLLRHTPSH